MVLSWSSLFQEPGRERFHTHSRPWAGSALTAWVRAKTGVFTQALEATVKYWHFVDVAWVFIYPTLYLVG